jgi:hypothetical protein
MAAAWFFNKIRRAPTFCEHRQRSGLSRGAGDDPCCAIAARFGDVSANLNISGPG